MADAKLDVKIGGISFTGEGSETWLSEQLKTILEAATAFPVHAEVTPPSSGHHAKHSEAGEKSRTTTTLRRI
jgi:hypothetical protein